ncbi:hypothetical protein ACFUMH_05415 [Cellulomonas sp. NPDC057328]|uniref:hypothetical protein n=1 Tax=Cellulomonas sp. NPDC057328 TaxID=3346101 RepID=UPI00363165B5
MRRPSAPVALASFCLFVLGFALTGSGRGWLGLVALVAASVVMSVAFAVRRRVTERPRDFGD